MVLKSTTKRSRPSPSPEASDSSSSEASSSRSAMEVEEATTADNSVKDRALSIDSDSEKDEDDEENIPESDSDIDSPQRPAIDATKARTKLHHVAKTLRATAKKTKTFEVQKLVKKLKGLRKKSSLSDQAELAEKELAALKSIDTGLLAGRALITKMVKARLLPRPAELEDADEEEHLYLQMVREEELLGDEVLTDAVAANGDRAVERAKAKITSSKVLADQVGRFVDELKKLAGIEPVKKDVEEDVKGKGKAKPDEEEEAEEEDREWSGSEEESDSEEDSSRRTLPLVGDDDEDEDEAEDEEELMRIGREKMKALGDLSQWDDMIGSDSSAESGSDDEEAPPTRKRKTHSASDVSNDDDVSEDDDSDGSDSENDLEDESGDSDADSDSESDASSSSSSSTDRPRKRKAASSSSKPSKKAKSSSSTFLPSLSTGFIAGRSDDEWSDAEADLADRDLSELRSGAKKERKNRMGQRARKALYEKKYGSNANHIKMREKKKAAKLERPAAPAGGRQRPAAFQAPAKRDGGWGGPVAPLPKQPKRPFVPRPVQTAAPVQSLQNGAGKAAAGVVPAAAAKSQEMHPSWIAKQKQKELMAQVKPQGKKVVFD